MRAVILCSCGLVVAGPPGALLGLAANWALPKMRRFRRRERPIRPILLVLLVELRSGRSVLAALQSAAAAFPSDPDLAVASRVATMAGVTAAAGMVGTRLRSLVSQLARAQRSGASLADTVRAAIEADILAEKTARLASARTLPVRLMIPITLLLLPGLVLLFYAPSMLRLFDELSAPLP
ncbi:MAG TPA: hypothetical protein VIC07_10500 [Acidimicrobiia bacterium]